MKKTNKLTLASLRRVTNLVELRQIHGGKYTEFEEVTAPSTIKPTIKL
jgi:hypothetical protein